MIRAVARRLEEGSFSEWPLARAAAWAWARASAPRIARPLAWDERVRLVAVGGATLGGSGKTPVSIALAERFAAAGEAVALIGHAYRATPERPRVVTPDDDLAAVGDEAIVCARALEGTGARVIVAPTRQAAVDFAFASGAERIVVDGMLQARPRRVDRSILVLDAAQPWGAGAVPPRGDLRAPREALLAACDDVWLLDEGAIRSRGVRVGDREEPWATIRPLTVGLVTSTARPDRIVRFLERRGIFPAVTVHAADHRPASIPYGAAVKVDVWLTTAKCAVHLERGAAPPGGAPLGVIEYGVDLHALEATLTRFAASHSLEKAEGTRKRAAARAIGRGEFGRPRPPHRKR